MEIGTLQRASPSRYPQGRLNHQRALMMVRTAFMYPGLLMTAFDAVPRSRKLLAEYTLAEKKTATEILASFKGTGPLRELLAQLNYDPLNEPVSRREWPEPAQVVLAQDPRLYGRAAGEFYIVYAQLAADKLKLTDERTVIPQLLKQYPYALFVFSDKAQKNFHFLNVKWENTQK